MRAVEHKDIGSLGLLIAGPVGLYAMRMPWVAYMLYWRVSSCALCDSNQTFGLIDSEMRLVGQLSEQSVSNMWRLMLGIVSSLNSGCSRGSHLGDQMFPKKLGHTLPKELYIWNYVNAI